MRNEPRPDATVHDEHPVSFAVDGGCFGCSAANPAGLQLTFRRRGEVIVADYVIAERFHGAPGIAHGGIIAAMLDEISCAVATFIRAVHVVTGEISVRYRRPCPVELPLTLTARITGEHARYVVIEAELRRDDELLAHSSGKFFFAGAAPTAP